MHRKFKLCLLTFILVLLNSCATNASTKEDIAYLINPTGGKKIARKKPTYRVRGKRYLIMNSSKDYQEKGVASWYGRQFHKKKTSSGERFNMYRLTAAHKTLPLSTRLLVTNLNNGRKVIVKVNDRGPFVSNRLIDLSYGAARKLGMVGLGLAPVSIQAIG